MVIKVSCIAVTSASIIIEIQNQKITATQNTNK